MSFVDKLCALGTMQISLLELNDNCKLGQEGTILAAFNIASHQCNIVSMHLCIFFKIQWKSLYGEGGYLVKLVDYKTEVCLFFFLFFFAFPFCDFCVLVSPNFGGLCPSLPFEGKVDDEHTSV